MQALARAVYSKEKLLLLDDCFSGLDAITEDRIFNRLFARTGVFRKHGVTVVLATHATHRLSFANKTIVLDGQGHLIEGPHHGRYLPSIAAKASLKNDEQESVEPAIEATIREPLDSEREEVVPDIDSMRSAGDWSTYVHYFRSCGWLNTTCFACGLCSFAVFMRMPGMIPSTGCDFASCMRIS